MFKARSTIFTTLILAVLGLVAIVQTSYAWLGVSRIPFISDVALTVITENGLFLAPDDNGKPGEWDTYLDASAFLSDIVPLKPVTYTANGFCRLIYDDTGRADTVTPLTEENINVRFPDENHSSAASLEAMGNGYMAAYPFWLKCEGSTAAEVSLSEPVERVDGQMGGGTYAVGKPVWSDASGGHVSGGYGSETTLRLAFECTPVDENGNPTGETSFVVYEPNADIHPGGADGFIETMNVSGGPLVPAEQHVIQNASTWEDARPALQDSVIYHAGEFTQNPPLFTISGGLMKVTLYIWMEGQDADCIARNVAESVSIETNVQFASSGETTDTGIVRPER